MKLSQAILILILITIPVITCAALKLENQYDGLSVSDGAADLFIYFVKMAIVFGVIIAVLVIIFNGINMIMAQGEMAKIIIAKQRILSVFIGLLILLGVYVIATTINPELVIIKMEDIKKLGDSIFKGGGSGVNPDTIEFQEVPLGTIAESILAANSSKRILGANDITEELCYAYDANGDTIDRNGDGQITPDGDTLRGVDMFYCIDELNQAIIKKVKALNADYLCPSNTTNGPMRKILKTIESKDSSGNYNCNCTRCSNWSYLNPAVPYACQRVDITCCTFDADGNETCTPGLDACDSNCGCCGKSYYAPNFGCQTDPYTAVNDHDPCVKKARDDIDCARNEIKIRTDGESLSPLPPGAEIANCPFTAFWEDPARDKEKFLTLKLAKERMESFENYYKNHLEDLNAAVIMMRDPYGERMSMAEFQTLKARGGQEKEITSTPFVGGYGYNYDPIKYCREFNCTTKNADGTCISGERDELTSSLYAKEQEFDQFYNVPDFKDRRICQVDDIENKEKYSYSGDGATFYYREKFKYEEAYEKETLRMVTDEAEKGYMESLIPLGEIINDARKFTEKLLEFTGMIKQEVDSVRAEAMEFANLPEKCDCALNCNTHPTSPTSGGKDSCSNPTCGTNTCDNCSTCASNKQGKCICCEDCETVTVPDSAFYWCAYNYQMSPALSNTYYSFNDNLPCILSPSTGFNYRHPMTFENIINNTYEAQYRICVRNDGSTYMWGFPYTGSECTRIYGCACPGDPGVGLGWYGPFAVSSCRYEGTKTIVTVAPSRTISYTVCEGEEAGELTNTDKKTIEDANLIRTIKWIEGENAIDVTGWDTGYFLKGCCGMYDNNGNGLDNVLKFSAGFTGWCAVEEGVHKIKITKTGAAKTTNDLSERGAPVVKPYYVCPYNELKIKQCKLFKYNSAFDSVPYPEDLKSGIECTDPTSSGIGRLQKIDLLAKRIENYGKGKNLKPGDPDRWTVLDILNLSRNKLDKCITGYSLPLKEGAKSYTLLSCGEGIDTLSSGSATIFPSFPYPSIPNMWNCQPYNSSYLTVDQKLACLNNKQHPDCTNAIINLLDDYYCLQRAE